MKPKHKKLLKLALPFYEKGREKDVVHIKWLVKTIPKFINEFEVDFDILMSLAILHDIGYSEIDRNKNPFNLDIRELHCQKGAEIAEKILRKLNYSELETAEIKRLVLKHDDWAIGDSFSDEPILRVFSNFDFMWMASDEGFDVVRKFLNKSPLEFCEKIREFEKNNKREGRSWINERIEKHYEELMRNRKNSVSQIK